METRNIADDLQSLEKILGVTFTDSDAYYFFTAITHRSYFNEHREAQQDHNERLEFLGDAVLELIVTDYLFRTYKPTSQKVS
jgi:ribonuclease-3